MPDQPDAHAPGPIPKVAAENIETVLKLREEAWAQRSWGERLADGVAGFVGQGVFMAAHAALFLLWAAFNTSLIPILPVFDPYPFNLFGTLVSLEAVVISVAVLIKQNRQGKMADRRAHLQLQMILLTEKEVTKVIKVLERLTDHLKVPDALDAETHELGEHTEISHMVDALHHVMPD